MYRVNPSPIKEQSRLAYHNNPTSAKMRSKVAYNKDYEGIKHKRRQTYNLLQQNLLDRHSLQKLVACAATKKYKKLCECLPNNFVSKIIRTNMRGKFSANDIELEHLVRFCMLFRDNNRKKFISYFKILKLSVLETLSKLHDASDNVDDAYELILGPSMHTASSESFFPTTTYHDTTFDKDSQVDVSKFPKVDVGKKQKNWTCSLELCKLDDKPEITRAVCNIYRSIAECDPIEACHYIQHMDDCDQPKSHDPSLAGHNELCHLDANACQSNLLYLRGLAPHFPNVRQLANMIYNVKRMNTQVCHMDQALQRGKLNCYNKL